MFALALRYLTARRRQTIFIMLGIILGAGGYVIISGMMLGFRLRLIKQLVDNDAHIRISVQETYATASTVTPLLYSKDTLVHWRVPPAGRKDHAIIAHAVAWVERLRADPRVAAFAKQRVVQAVAHRASVTLPVRVIGCEPGAQEQVTALQDAMVEGQFRDIGSSGNRIVVGDELLRDLGASVGERINISLGDGNPVVFMVVGAFHLGVRNYDRSMAYAALADVQQMAGRPGQISDIAIRLHDVSAARAVATEWSRIGTDTVESWDQANSGMLSVFKTQDIVRYSMTGTILLVAGFGIYNILNMLVQQKRREIAILRAMGYTGRDVVALFVWQGCVIGAIGGVLGLGFGYGVCRWMETIPVDTSRFAGGAGMMLVAFLPSIYVQAFCFAFTAAMVASVVPARAAAKLSPLQILRSDG